MKILFVTNYKDWNKDYIPFHKSFYGKCFATFCTKEKDDFASIYIPSVTNIIKVILYNIKFLFYYIRHNPDTIYCPINIYLIALVVFLKSIGVLKCKIYRWKYTPCVKSNNKIKNKILIKYFSAFDKVYFLTKMHMEDSLESGILKDCQTCFINYGIDINWFDTYKKNNNSDNFIIISTGVENRDLDTLCKSVIGTSLFLHIITKKKYLDLDNIAILKPYMKVRNIRIDFTEDLITKKIDVLDYIEKSVASSKCVAVCTKQVNYGVGYTQVVESLPFGIPILETCNIANPIDVEKFKIGFNIPIGNVELWKQKFLLLMHDENISKEFGKNARRLAMKEFNGIDVAQSIYEDIIHIKR